MVVFYLEWIGLINERVLITSYVVLFFGSSFHQMTTVILGEIIHHYPRQKSSYRSSLFLPHEFIGISRNKMVRDILIYNEGHRNFENQINQ